MDTLVLGLSLGLGAGLAPGPLMALVIRSTLQNGLAGGVRVAFSPLVTDLPIIVLALTIVATLSDAAVGVLGIVGGCFVLWLGVEALRAAPVLPDASAGTPVPMRDILHGALVNALSPHPWVFWITVGAPVIAEHGAAGNSLFISAFYLLLIGSKVAIAVALNAGRDRLLQGRGYTIVLRTSALLLLTCGVLLSVEGLKTVA